MENLPAKTVCTSDNNILVNDTMDVLFKVVQE